MNLYELSYEEKKLGRASAEAIPEVAFFNLTKKSIKSQHQDPQVWLRNFKKGLAFLDKWQEDIKSINTHIETINRELDVERKKKRLDSKKIKSYDDLLTSYKKHKRVYSDQREKLERLLRCVFADALAILKSDPNNSQWLAVIQAMLEGLNGLPPDQQTQLAERLLAEARERFTMPEALSAPGQPSSVLNDMQGLVEAAQNRTLEDSQLPTVAETTLSPSPPESSSARKLPPNPKKPSRDSVKGMQAHKQYTQKEELKKLSQEKGAILALSVPQNITDFITRAQAWSKKMTDYLAQKDLPKALHDHAQSELDDFQIKSEEKARRAVQVIAIKYNGLVTDVLIQDNDEVLQKNYATDYRPTVQNLAEQLESLQAALPSENVATIFWQAVQIKDYDLTRKLSDNMHAYLKQQLDARQAEIWQRYSDLEIENSVKQSLLATLEAIRKAENLTKLASALQNFPADSLIKQVRKHSDFTSAWGKIFMDENIDQSFRNSRPETDEAARVTLNQIIQATAQQSLTGILCTYRQQISEIKLAVSSPDADLDELTQQAQQILAKVQEGIKAITDPALSQQISDVEQELSKLIKYIEQTKAWRTFLKGIDERRAEIMRVVDNDTETKSTASSDISEGFSIVSTRDPEESSQANQNIPDGFTGTPTSAFVIHAYTPEWVPKFFKLQNAKEKLENLKRQVNDKAEAMLVQDPEADCLGKEPCLERLDGDIQEIEDLVEKHKTNYIATVENLIDLATQLLSKGVAARWFDDETPLLEALAVVQGLAQAIAEAKHILAHSSIFTGAEQLDYMPSLDRSAGDLDTVALNLLVNQFIIKIKALYDQIDSADSIAALKQIKAKLESETRGHMATFEQAARSLAADTVGQRLCELLNQRFSSRIPTNPRYSGKNPWQTLSISTENSGMLGEIENGLLRNLEAYCDARIQALTEEEDQQQKRARAMALLQIHREATELLDGEKVPDAAQRLRAAKSNFQKAFPSPSSTDSVSVNSAGLDVPQQEIDEVAALFDRRIQGLQLLQDLWGILDEVRATEHTNSTTNPWKQTQYEELIGDVFNKFAEDKTPEDLQAAVEIVARFKDAEGFAGIQLQPNEWERLASGKQLPRIRQRVLQGAEELYLKACRVNAQIDKAVSPLRQTLDRAFGAETLAKLHEVLANGEKEEGKANLLVQPLQESMRGVVNLVPRENADSITKLLTRIHLVKICKTRLRQLADKRQYTFAWNLESGDVTKDKVNTQLQDTVKVMLTSWFKAWHREYFGDGTTQLPTTTLSQQVEAITSAPDYTAAREAIANALATNKANTRGFNVIRQAPMPGLNRNGDNLFLEAYTACEFAASGNIAPDQLLDQREKALKAIQGSAQAKANDAVDAILTTATKAAESEPNGDTEAAFRDAAAAAQAALDALDEAVRPWQDANTKDKGIYQFIAPDELTGRVEKAKKALQTAHTKHTADADAASTQATQRAESLHKGFTDYIEKIGKADDLAALMEPLKDTKRVQDCRDAFGRDSEPQDRAVRKQLAKKFGLADGFTTQEAHDELDRQKKEAFNNTLAKIESKITTRKFVKLDAASLIARINSATSTETLDEIADEFRRTQEKAQAAIDFYSQTLSNVSMAIEVHETRGDPAEHLQKLQSMQQKLSKAHATQDQQLKTFTASVSAALTTRRELLTNFAAHEHDAAEFVRVAKIASQAVTDANLGDAITALNNKPLEEITQREVDALRQRITALREATYQCKLRAGTKVDNRTGLKREAQRRKNELRPLTEGDPLQSRWNTCNVNYAEAIRLFDQEIPQQLAALGKSFEQGPAQRIGQKDHAEAQADAALELLRQVHQTSAEQISQGYGVLYRSRANGITQAVTDPDAQAHFVAQFNAGCGSLGRNLSKIDDLDGCLESAFNQRRDELDAAKQTGCEQVEVFNQFVAGIAEQQNVSALIDYLVADPTSVCMAEYDKSDEFRAQRQQAMRDALDPGFSNSEGDFATALTNRVTAAVAARMASLLNAHDVKPLALNDIRFVKSRVDAANDDRTIKIAREAIQAARAQAASEHARFSAAKQACQADQQAAAGSRNQEIGSQAPALQQRVVEFQGQLDEIANHEATLTGLERDLNTRSDLIEDLSRRQATADGLFKVAAAAQKGLQDKHFDRAESDLEALDARLAAIDAERNQPYHRKTRQTARQQVTAAQDALPTVPSALQATRDKIADILTQAGASLTRQTTNLAEYERKTTQARDAAIKAEAKARADAFNAKLASMGPTKPPAHVIPKSITELVELVAAGQSQWIHNAVPSYNSSATNDAICAKMETFLQHRSTPVLALNSTNIKDDLQRRIYVQLRTALKPLIDRREGAVSSLEQRSTITRPEVDTNNLQASHAALTKHVASLTSLLEQVNILRESIERDIAACKRLNNATSAEQERLQKLLTRLNTLRQRLNVDIPELNQQADKLSEQIKQATTAAADGGADAVRKFQTYVGNLSAHTTVAILADAVQRDKTQAACVELFDLQDEFTTARQAKMAKQLGVRKDQFKPTLPNRVSTAVTETMAAIIEAHSNKYGEFEGKRKELPTKDSLQAKVNAVVDDATLNTATAAIKAAQQQSAALKASINQARTSAQADLNAANNTSPEPHDSIVAKKAALAELVAKFDEPLKQLDTYAASLTSLATQAKTNAELAKDYDRQAANAQAFSDYAAKVADEIAAATAPSKTLRKANAKLKEIARRRNALGQVRKKLREIKLTPATDALNLDNAHQRAEKTALQAAPVANAGLVAKRSTVNKSLSTAVAALQAQRDALQRHEADLAAEQQVVINKWVGRLYKLAEELDKQTDPRYFAGDYPKTDLHTRVDDLIGDVQGTDHADAFIAAVKADDRGDTYAWLKADVVAQINGNFADRYEARKAVIKAVDTKHRAFTGFLAKLGKAANVVGLKDFLSTDKTVTDCLQFFDKDDEQSRFQQRVLCLRLGIAENSDRNAVADKLNSLVSDAVAKRLDQLQRAQQQRVDGLVSKVAKLAKHDQLKDAVFASTTQKAAKNVVKSAQVSQKKLLEQVKQAIPAIQAELACMAAGQPHAAKLNKHQTDYNRHLESLQALQKQLIAYNTGIDAILKANHFRLYTNKVQTQTGLPDILKTLKGEQACLAEVTSGVTELSVAQAIMDHIDPSIRLSASDQLSPALQVKVTAAAKQPLDKHLTKRTAEVEALGTQTTIEDFSVQMRAINRPRDLVDTRTAIDKEIERAAALANQMTDKLAELDADILQCTEATEELGVGGQAAVTDHLEQLRALRTRLAEMQTAFNQEQVKLDQQAALVSRDKVDTHTGQYHRYRDQLRKAPALNNLLDLLPQEEGVVAATVPNPENEFTIRAIAAVVGLTPPVPANNADLTKSLQDNLAEVGVESAQRLLAKHDRTITKLQGRADTVNSFDDRLTALQTEADLTDLQQDILARKANRQTLLGDVRALLRKVDDDLVACPNDTECTGGGLQTLQHTREGLQAQRVRLQTLERQVQERVDALQRQYDLAPRHLVNNRFGALEKKYNAYAAYQRDARDSIRRADFGKSVNALRADVSNGVGDGAALLTRVTRLIEEIEDETEQRYELGYPEEPSPTRRQEALVELTTGDSNPDDIEALDWLAQRLEIARFEVRTTPLRRLRQTVRQDLQAQLDSLRDLSRQANALRDQLTNLQQAEQRYQGLLERIRDAGTRAELLQARDAIADAAREMTDLLGEPGMRRFFVTWQTMLGLPADWPDTAPAIEQSHAATGDALQGAIVARLTAYANQRIAQREQATHNELAQAAIFIDDFLANAYRYPAQIGDAQALHGYDDFAGIGQNIRMLVQFISLNPNIKTGDKPYAIQQLLQRIRGRAAELGYTDFADEFAFGAGGLFSLNPNMGDLTKDQLERLLLSYQQGRLRVNAKRYGAQWLEEHKKLGTGPSNPITTYPSLRAGFENVAKARTVHELARYYGYHRINFERIANRFDPQITLPPAGLPRSTKAALVGARNAFNAYGLPVDNLRKADVESWGNLQDGMLKRLRQQARARVSGLAQKLIDDSALPSVTETIPANNPPLRNDLPDNLTPCVAAIEEYFGNVRRAVSQREAAREAFHKHAMRDNQFLSDYEAELAPILRTNAADEIREITELKVRQLSQRRIFTRELTNLRKQQSQYVVDQISLIAKPMLAMLKSDSALHLQNRMTQAQRVFDLFLEKQAGNQEFFLHMDETVRLMVIQKLEHQMAALGSTAWKPITSVDADKQLDDLKANRQAVIREMREKFKVAAPRVYGTVVGHSPLMFGAAASAGDTGPVISFTGSPLSDDQLKAVLQRGSPLLVRSAGNLTYNVSVNSGSGQYSCRADFSKQRTAAHSDDPAFRKARNQAVTAMLSCVVSARPKTVTLKGTVAEVIFATHWVQMLRTHLKMNSGDYEKYNFEFKVTETDAASVTAAQRAQYEVEAKQLIQEQLVYMAKQLDPTTYQTIDDKAVYDALYQPPDGSTSADPLKQLKTLADKAAPKVRDEFILNRIIDTQERECAAKGLGDATPMQNLTKRLG